MNTDYIQARQITRSFVIVMRANKRNTHRVGEKTQSQAQVSCVNEWAPGCEHSPHNIHNHDMNKMCFNRQSRNIPLNP